MRCSWQGTFLRVIKSSQNPLGRFRRFRRLVWSRFFCHPGISGKEVLGLGRWPRGCSRASGGAFLQYCPPHGCYASLPSPPPERKWAGCQIALLIVASCGSWVRFVISRTGSRPWVRFVNPWRVRSPSKARSTKSPKLVQQGDYGCLTIGICSTISIP